MPAQGWFEWQTTPAGKQPHVIPPAKGAAPSFAAPWERRHDQGEALETFTVITTAASTSRTGLEQPRNLNERPRRAAGSEQEVRGIEVGEVEATKQDGAPVVG